MFLVYFILGIIFYILICPIFQNLASYLATLFAKKIYQIQKEMETTEEDLPQKYPIGFHTDCIGSEISEEEYDQEDYE